jgi:hypothetical protein
LEEGEEGEERERGLSLRGMESKQKSKLKNG